MDALLAWVAGQGLRRGAMAGNRVWLVAWIAAHLIRRARRADAGVVYRWKLAPGQALVVVDGPAGVEAEGAPPAGRRARRA